jgi:Major tropism determinant N-terminal domain
MSNAVQVQRRRGTAAQMATFVGAQGELAATTGTNRIHLHDGATPGGWPAAQLLEVGMLKIAARAINLNALGDTAVVLSLPPGIANYRVDRVYISDSQGASIPPPRKEAWRSPSSRR